MGKVRWQLAQPGNWDRVMEIHEIIVLRFEEECWSDHSCNNGKVGMPIIVNDVFLKWTGSDAGKFIKQHAVTNIKCSKMYDYMHDKNICVILAELEAKKLTEFYLRWGNPNGNN
jgi:hypothetical protein